MIVNKIKATDASNSGAAAAPGDHASGGHDAELDAQVKKGVRMIVILNNRKQMEGGLYFLERRGYQIYVCNRISDAIQNMQNFKPHTILLSWNLKNTDVRKAYKLLTEKFNLLCIVFAEDNSTRTTASLMSSGIPHSLLAPVSGPSIHMRVQALLRAKIAGTRERKKKQVPEYHTEETVDGSKLPPDVAWEKSTEPNGETVWNGKSPTDHDKTYYFKGPAAPRFNKEKQRWTREDGKEELGTVIMKGPKKSKLHKAVQEAKTGQAFDLEESLKDAGEFQAVQEGQKHKGYKLETSVAEGEEFAVKEGHTDSHESEDSHETVGIPPDLEDDFDWEAALNEVTNKELGDLEQSLHDAFKEEDVEAAAPAMIEPSAQGHADKNSVPHYEEGEVAKKKSRATKLGSESLLFKAIKSTAGHLFNSPPETPKKLDLVSFAQPVLVKTPRFRGIMYVASSTDRDYGDILQEFTRNLSIALNEAGEDGIITLLPRFKINALPFTSFFRDKGDFVIPVANGDDTIGFAFFGTVRLPKIDESGEADILTVSLEQDIIGGEELLFDLFLHLPRNNKFILYLNHGATMSERCVSKFLGFGVKQVHIRKKDKELFLSYWSRGLIKSNI